ncbi:MAG: CPBP family glutamic-type intramembrane protease, partial [Blastocatellia bacterium]
MRNAQAGLAGVSDLPSAEQPRKSLGPVVAYILGFYAVWMVYVYVIYPRMVLLGDRTLAYAAVSLTIRFLVWVLPVFLYLRHFDQTSPIEYLKLRQFWKRGIVIGLGLSVINFLGTVLRFGSPHPSLQNVTWNSILGTSILVGFFEEIPFRGFLLQKFEEHYGFWIANL